MMHIMTNSISILIKLLNLSIKSPSLIDMKSVLPSCQFIFNTIPTLVLDKSNLAYVDPKVTIIDIASQPGGVDYEYALKNNLYAKLCLGIPGKVSPRTSADILLTGIVTFMKERSD
jgi:dipicolinate synthase subunit A